MLKRLKHLSAPMLLVGALIALLAGCANPVKESNRQSDQAEGQANSAVQQLEQANQASRETYIAHQGQWVDPTPVAVDAITTTAQLDCVEQFHPRYPMAVEDFAQTVGKDCGIVIRVSPDAIHHLNKLATDTAMMKGSASSPAIPPSASMGVTLPGVAGTGITPQSVGFQQTRMIDLSYTGPLAGLLDQATSQLGLSWHVEKGAIEIFYLETRTFRFSMISSVTQMTTAVMSGTTATMGVSGGASGGGSGSSSTGGVGGTSGTSQETDVTIKSDLRKDFQETIAQMISADGRVGPLTTTGTITVTDTPDRINAIQSYVDEQNGILVKQVLFKVKVLAVTVNNTDSYGINWNLVFKSLNGNFGFNLSNTFSAAQGATNNQISVLPAAKGKAAQFAGSTALINALAEQGKVAVVTTSDASTLNMQPALVQVAKETGFLESEQTSNVAQVGSSTSLQQGMITSGFNMNLIPNVLGDNESILVQYNMNLASDPVLRTVTSNSSIVEIPSMDTKILSQKVEMKSGETLILSGFEQKNLDGSTQGIGSPKFWALGGGLNRNDSHVVLVVLITPIIAG